MTDLDKIMSGLDDTMTNLGKIITDVGKTMTDLERIMTNLDKIMTDTDKDRKFELYKQLHEQYAVNDNNKTSSVISFLAAIFSVFVGYGFALYNDDKGDCLLAVTMASQLILLFICILCLFFGYSTRRDQFITYEIRKKYNVQIPYTDPFNRKVCRFTFLPDYYAIMYYGCIAFMLTISLLSRNKLLDMGINNDISYFNRWAIGEIIALFLVLYCFTYFYYLKYQDFKGRKYDL